LKRFCKRPRESTIPSSTIKGNAVLVSRNKLKKESAVREVRTVVKTDDWRARHAGERLEANDPQPLNLGPARHEDIP
jgi:hypothetical protein